MDYKKLIRVTDSEVQTLDSELVSKWNDYCDENSYPDDMIYSMDDFDELMSGQTPWDIAKSVYFGEFNPNKDWFWFNGYGNLCSGEYTTENGCPIQYASDFNPYGEEEEEIEEDEEEVTEESEE